MQSCPPPPAIPATAEAVVTFLESVGRRLEAELYLKLFTELPRESFAIVAVDAGLLRHSAGALAEQLRFLADLGLYAPLVVGPLDTSSTTAAADRLVRRLRAAGLEPAVYEVPQADVATALRAELGAARVPVICFSDPNLGVDARFVILAHLARELASRKLVLLRRRGAIGAELDRVALRESSHAIPTNADGISVVNLRTDYVLLAEQRLLRRDDAELLGRLRVLLDSPGLGGLRINVTSPMAMLKELFTVRGAGTLVKRGTDILKFNSYQSLDRARLRQLLESSFRATLNEEFFNRPLLAAYLEPDYRAAALLEPSRIAPILSKFAVEPIAQGEGMGRDLWRELIREHPQLIWRARSDNPICSWYSWQCDGMVRSGQWTVYFRGVATEQVPAVIEELVGRSEDFNR